MAIVDKAEQQGQEDPCNQFIFTDGSARKMSRKLTYDNWGFTVMENSGKGDDLPLFVHVALFGQMKMENSGWVQQEQRTTRQRCSR